MAEQRETQSRALLTVPNPSLAARRDGPGALVTLNPEGAERLLGVRVGKPKNPHCVESCGRPFFKGRTQGLARQ